MTDTLFDIATATPEQAQARLDGLVADRDWSRALAKKHDATFSEFDALSRRIVGAEPDVPATDQLVDMIVGGAVPPAIETVSGGELTARDKLHAIAQLREAGQTDTGIMEIFSGLDSRTGKPFDAETVSLAKSWRGEYEARSQLRLFSAIIAFAA